MPRGKSWGRGRDGLDPGKANSSSPWTPLCRGSRWCSNGTPPMPRTCSPVRSLTAGRAASTGCPSGVHLRDPATPASAEEARLSPASQQGDWGSPPVCAGLNDSSWEALLSSLGLTLTAFPQHGARMWEGNHHATERAGAEEMIGTALAALRGRLTGLAAVGAAALPSASG